MGIKIGGRSTLNTGNNYYNEVTLTDAYQEISFGFPAQKVTLVNDSDTDVVQVSWDGTTVHHELEGAEYKDLTGGGRTSIHVKATIGSEDVRITAE